MIKWIASKLGYVPEHDLRIAELCLSKAEAKERYNSSQRKAELQVLKQKHLANLQEATRKADMLVRECSSLRTHREPEFVELYYRISRDLVESIRRTRSDETLVRVIAEQIAGGVINAKMD